MTEREAEILEAYEAEQLALRRRRKALRIILPLLTLLAALALWELLVTWHQVPHYIIPAPTRIFETLLAEGGSLLAAFWFTLKLTLLALALAVVGGVLIGLLFSLSPLVEISFFPFAVILQVTPVIAIAPLIMIYVDSTFAALLICAWIVAFFPVVTGTVTGLRSVDHGLADLFRLYKAGPWQRFRHLLIPSALPYFLSSLKVAGGLSLIGAVVAEFVAGAAGRDTGLASRILEAGYRNEIPRMFAALILVALAGVLIYLLTHGLSRLLLGRWHESERERDS